MKKHQKIGTALLSLTLMLCTACTPIETNPPVEDSLTAANAGIIFPTELDPIETASAENRFSKVLSSMEDGTIKGIGDTVRINSGDKIMEYTVQNVQIFDHYTDTGIPKSEFDFGLSDLPFIMVEVKIKKVSGPEWIDENHKDLITNLCLYNRSMLEEGSKENSVACSEICYFDGDPGVVGKEEGYYWLDPGEEKVFQVGWCVHEPLTGRDKIDAYLNDTEGLVLNVSPHNWGEGEFIDLTIEN